MATWQVGAATVTRLAEEGFELVLAQDDATTETLRSQSSWLSPHFITDRAELRIGSSAIVIRSAGHVIVVDPWLAFDGPDRLAPDAAARIARLLDAVTEEVDFVVNTHLDGLGANTRPVDDREVAGFPNARYLLAGEELDALRAGQRSGAEAFDQVLVAEGRVDLVSPGHQVTPEVTLVPAAGHSAGHFAVEVSSGDERALVPGHLFLHPAQVYDPGPRAGLDEDPEVSARSRRAILEQCAEEGSLLIGPLFAEPGGGRVVGQGDRWRLEV